jgi:hypothetical protein
MPGRKPIWIALLLMLGEAYCNQIGPLGLSFGKINYKKLFF